MSDWTAPEDGWYEVTPGQVPGKLDDGLWLPEWVEQRILSTDDGLVPLPPCRCIDAGDGISITNRCALHNPATGLLIKRPVSFTGLLDLL